MSVCLYRKSCLTDMAPLTAKANNFLGEGTTSPPKRIRKKTQPTPNSDRENIFGKQLMLTIYVPLEASRGATARKVLIIRG